MPAYKDEKTGKWFAKFYYTNWQGIKKQKWKRGFATKKEALGFERDFLKSARSSDTVWYLLSGVFCVHFKIIFSKLIGQLGAYSDGFAMSS